MERTTVAGLALVAFAGIAVFTMRTHPRAAHGQQASTGLPSVDLYGATAPTLACSATINAAVPYTRIYADTTSALGYRIVRYACLPNQNGVYGWQMGAMYPPLASTISGLSTVATSGLYSDLSGLPTIPAAVTSLPYTSITGTPTIPSVTGLQTAAQVSALIAANAPGYVTSAQAAAAAPVQSVNGLTGAVTVTVPTKLSQLTNDSGYLTSTASTSASCTIGALVSLGTQSCPVTLAGAAVGSTYLCVLSAPSATVQSALAISDGNVMTAGTINVVVTNKQAVALSGSPVVTIKCLTTSF